MNCPILNMFTKCRCCDWMICPFCAQLVIAVFAIIFGTLLAWKPKKTIDVQAALYRPFNWKLEPISMEKEIRNTRVMGLVALIAGIVALVYALLSS